MPGAWAIWDTLLSLQNTKYHKTLDLLTCPNSPTTIVGVGLSALLNFGPSHPSCILQAQRSPQYLPRNDLKAGLPLGTAGLKSTEVNLPGGKWAILYLLPSSEITKLAWEEGSQSVLRPQHEDIATHNDKR